MTTSTARWAVRGVVVVVALGWFMVRPPEEVPVEVTGPGPEHELVVETVPPPSSALEPGPRPDVPGAWVVYVTGARYCCDEQGRAFDPPVREVVCVPARQLDAGVPEADLDLWRVPVPSRRGAPVGDGDPCPVP